MGSFTVLIKYLPQAGANTFLRGFDPVLLARVRYLIIPANFGSEKYLRWDLRLGPRETPRPSQPATSSRDLRLGDTWLRDERVAGVQGAG